MDCDAVAKGPMTCMNAESIDVPRSEANCESQAMLKCIDVECLHSMVEAITCTQTDQHVWIVVQLSMVPTSEL